MAVTVKDALQTEGLIRAQVVAGHRGLTNAVENVTVMESPEVAVWLRGKEMVLSSLYAVEDHPQAYKRLVESLVKVGCAALIVKTGRKVATIPSALIAAANRCDLPVIELPTQVRYVDVITALMERILTEKARLLRHSEWIHRSLTRAALSGGGLKAIVTALSSLASCHVALLDPVLQCVGTNDEADQTALTTWLEAHEPSSETWTGIVNRYTELPGPEGQRALVIPVWVEGATQGYLLCWPLRLPLHEETDVIFEHAVTMSAIELLKQQAIKQVERRYHDEVLADLVQGRIFEQGDLKQRARHFDWDLQATYRVMLVDLSAATRDAPGESLRRHAVEATLRLVRGLEPRPVIGQIQTALAVFLPQGAAPRLESDLEGLARSIQVHIAYLLGSHGRPAVGISEAADSLLSLRRPYEEARDALQLGRMTKGGGSITCFAQLGVYRLLKDCAPALQAEFIRSTIQPVLDQDRQKGSTLMETLEAYFDASGQVKTAADKLFVHVNTVKYRLGQIEELTGHSPERPEGALHLLLGLRLIELLGWRHPSA
jgi:purine catabolism regulator